MKRVTGFLLLFGLLWMAFCSPLQAQIPQHRFPAATDRVLLGWAPGTPMSRIEEILAAEQCFLQPDARMWVTEGQMIGWIMPTAQAPQSQDDLYSLLDRLEQHPELRYVHPFIHAGKDLRGLSDKIVLKLRPDANPAVIAQQAERLGLHMAGASPYLPRVHFLRADKQAVADPISLVLHLRDQPEFEYVDVDYLLNPVVSSNDPLYTRQWALHNIGSAPQGSGIADSDMDVPDAWVITKGDSTIRIAIIDCGIDTMHEDLVDNLLPGHDATGGSSQGYPNTTYPNDAHGTNCAGIVAAQSDNGLGIAGVCPECSVFPVKVFYYVFNPFGEPLPYASGTAMAEAISWAWQVGNADVLSNSWGLFDNLLPLLPGGTAIVEDAIALALDSARGGKGGLLFFSSGNDGGAPLWPGRMAGCFSVNATTMCDERKHPASCDGQDWEGNWGDSLDVSAPGVMIAATDMSGSLGYDPSNYYLEFGGTSAACPNAAGVMGLVLSVAPYLDLAQAHFVLESTCDRVGGYAYTNTTSSGTHSSELGHGRLNAHQAVLAAQNVTNLGEMQETAHGTVQSWYSSSTQQLEVVVNLAKPSPIMVSITDLQGRNLLTWNYMQERRESYKASWNLSEQGISAGIYLIRVQSEHWTQTNKILIYK